MIPQYLASITTWLILRGCLFDNNPLSTMVAILHDIIVSFKALAQKVFIGTWISWVKCIRERLAGAKMSLAGWMLDVWAVQSPHMFER